MTLVVVFGAIVLSTIAIVLVHSRPTIPLTGSGSFVRDGEFPSGGTEGIRGPRYGSWNGSDQHAGALRSAVFTAPTAIAVMLAGYPSHPAERLELVRADDQRVRLRFTIGVDPQQQWQARILPVPSAWRGQRVYFMATDAGRDWGDWLGVADVRPADFGDTLDAWVASVANDERIQLLGFIVFAGVLVIPCLGVAVALGRRLSFPSLLVFTTSLLILGGAAELTFFLTMVNVVLARTVVLVAAAIGTMVTLILLRDPDFSQRLRQPDVWIPFAVTSFGAVGYAALLSLGIDVSGTITGDIEGWLRMPVDNVLPYILADHIIAHAPPEPFVGDWFSSDRPPLQAAFALLYGFIVPFGNEVTRYQAISMLLQAAIFGVLFTLCRLAGTSTFRAIGILLLAGVSGFFFLNTLFVWPKLLAAAFGACAVSVYLAGRSGRVASALLIGLSTGLALLSHGGVVFTFPALAVAWIVHEREKAVRPIGIALATLIVVVAPWTWYQRVYDPPGDRLLKMHLAGQPHVSTQSFGTELLHAYTAVTPATIASNKFENLAAVIGLNTPYMSRSSSPLRDRQFFYVRFALSALAIPFVAALFLMRSRSAPLRWASRFAWITIAANVFWCLVMYGPNTSTVHQGSYLTIALMYLAAGCVATEWPAIFGVVLVAQTSLFVLAWLPVFQRKTAFTGGFYLDVSVLVLLGVIAAVSCEPPIRERIRRWRARPAPAARSDVTGDFAVVCAVAIAMILILAVSRHGIALILVP